MTARGTMIMIGVRMRASSASFRAYQAVSAEKAARGETTRRRRRRRRRGRYDYCNPEFVPLAYREPAPRPPVVGPTGPGLDAWGEAMELASQPGGFEIDLRAMFWARDQELIDP